MSKYVLKLLHFYLIDFFHNNVYLRATQCMFFCVCVYCEGKELHMLYAQAVDFV